MIRFTYLKAEDTFSYRRLDFDFATGLHSVSGANGSSKTSIFLSLIHGLYNRNPKNCKVDEVSCNITGKPYHIEVTFEQGNDGYVVINSKKLGTVQLFKNGKDISLKRIPDTLKMIQEVLGCDYDQFCDLVYQSKNSTLNILDSSTNKGRAEFVNRVLKLDELDSHFKRLEDKRKAYESKNGTLAGLREQINLAEATLNNLVEVGEELPEADVTEVAEQTVVNNQLLQQLSAEIAIVKKQIALADAQAETLVKRKKLEQRLLTLPVPDVFQKDVDEALKRTRALVTKQSEQLKTIKAEYDKLLAAKEAGTCYACGHGIEVGIFDSEIANLKVAGNQLKEDQAQQKAVLTKYEGYYQQWVAIAGAKIDLSQLPVYSESPDKEACQIHLATLLAEQQLLQKQQEELGTTVRESYKVKEYNASIRAQHAMNRKITENNQKVMLLLDQKRKELQEAEVTVDLLKTWAGILGPKGYRTSKTAGFLKNMNSTMAKYSKLMCGGKIACRFYLDEKGEINFEISDGTKTQDIALWSGGETARIKIVCLFAVLELLEAAGSVSFNVLCLDEIFSALDAEGKEGLFKVLAYLRKRNKAIYIIAHEELTLDMTYDSVIKAEKLLDGTTRILQ